MGSCGVCSGRLIGWGSYGRRLRQGSPHILVRVVRRRCRMCGRTAAALPEGVLDRRLDDIDTVGRIIAAGIRGTTVREIADATGLPSRTVRDIRARYRDHAPALATRLLALSVTLGGRLSLALDIPVEPERRAAFGLGAAWTAARRHGAPEATPWRWLANISGGRVLPTTRACQATVAELQSCSARRRPPGMSRVHGRSGLGVDARPDERHRPCEGPF